MECFPHPSSFIPHPLLCALFPWRPCNFRRTHAATFPAEVPLRILHVIASHRWTGAAEPAARLAASQLELGHDVLKAEELGVKFDEGVPFDRTYLPWRKYRDFQALRGLIERFRPETVHSHLTHDHMMTALALRGNSQARLVRSFHREEKPRTGIAFRKVAMAGTSGAVAVSSAMAAAIAEAYGFSPAQVFANRGCIDAEQFHPGSGARLRAQWNIPADAMVFGVVSRVRETRGFPWLLDAAAKALPRLPNARLVICGRGTWLDTLLERIAAHPAREQIHYAGYVTGDDLLESYRAFDASLLLKPGNDGTCRAALESMASECPVIGGDMGALRDLLGASGTGWLAPVDDAESLAKAMVEVAGSADERRRRGKIARSYIESDFTERGAAARMVEFYERLPAPARR
jgi:glycosyltransferase involved in cell wall biosynthesis